VFFKNVFHGKTNYERKKCMKSQKNIKRFPAILLLLAAFVLAMPMATPALADVTGLKSPTTYATGTTGNPPSYPGQALVDDVATGGTNDAVCALFRTVNSGGGGGVADSEIYDGFTFGIPSGATIDGIEVVVSGYRTGTPSVGAYFRICLDGGSGWTAYKDTSTLTTVDAEYTLGGSGDDWSGDWSLFSDANFKLEIIPAGPTLNGESWKLDSVRVTVYYTVTGGSISGAKFYDADTDGVWDAEEPAIEGFKIELYDDGETLLDTQFTDENGEYLFDELDAGTYTVKEVLPSGWVNTTDDSITIEDLSGPSEDNNFGNVCIGCDGGANGKGWWTNNGADDGTDDLPALCLLNLRDEDGDPFDPTLYGIKETGKFPEGTFAYWLQEADAENMAYMLSAQLAAMELNVLNGFVDDEALVYAPGTDSANAAGFASIGDLMSEADAELGLHGTAMAGDGWRDYQEAMKNALDAANNNVNFVCPEPCLPIEYPIL
jgi:hypothetical protein